MSGEGSGRYPRPGYEAELSAEIVRFRAALEKMSSDWQLEREQNRSLRAENEELKRRLAAHGEPLQSA